MTSDRRSRTTAEREPDLHPPEVLKIADERKRIPVTWEMLERVMKDDKVEVEGRHRLHPHRARPVDSRGRRQLDQPIRTACTVLDGYDKWLLEWVADSGLAAIAADNLAVERSSTLGGDPRIGHRGAQLPLHEHCLVKLGIHLGALVSDRARGMAASKQEQPFSADRTAAAYARCGRLSGNAGGDGVN